MDIKYFVPWTTISPPTLAGASCLLQLDGVPVRAGLSTLGWACLEEDWYLICCWNGVSLTVESLIFA